jgi:hypothetical protein
LFRSSKHSTARHRAICWLVLAIHVVDIFWILGPDLGYTKLTVPLQPLAALVGIGGLWVGAYTLFLKGKPLLSLNDPALVALMESDRRHAHGHGHAHSPAAPAHGPHA